MPVSGYVDAAAPPDIIEGPGITNKTFHCSEASGPARQAAMQPHRHHARSSRTFRVEHIKTVFQVLVKLLAAVETLGRGEAHVIHIQCVGDDQVGAAVTGVPPRQIVVVIICIVEETTFFNDQPACVGAAAPGIPAKRALAATISDRKDSDAPSPCRMQLSPPSS